MLSIEHWQQPQGGGAGSGADGCVLPTEKLLLLLPLPLVRLLELDDDENGPGAPLLLDAALGPVELCDGGVGGPPSELLLDTGPCEGSPPDDEGPPLVDELEEEESIAIGALLMHGNAPEGCRSIGDVVPIHLRRAHLHNQLNTVKHTQHHSTALNTR